MNPASPPSKTSWGGCITLVVLLGAVLVAVQFVKVPPLETVPEVNTIVPEPDALPAPAPVPANVVPPASPIPAEPMTAVDLETALRNGDVTATIRGDGLEGIEVTLVSRREAPFQVVLTAGTRFKPRSSGVQSMILRQAATFTLQHRADTQTQRLDAACGNMHKDTPDKSDLFALDDSPAADAILRLTALPEFAKASFRVQQFAIWTLTDDPDRQGFTGIGAFFSGAGPSDQEFHQIHALLRAASIEPTQYYAFGKSRTPASSAPMAPSPPPSFEVVPLELIPSRVWTDKNGRKMTARLVNAELDDQGRMKGIFESANGQRFDYLIGQLSVADIQLVKETMSQRGLVPAP